MTNKVNVISGTGFVDNLPVDHMTIEIHQEQIAVDHTAEPDPNWEYIDKKGHYHAYNANSKSMIGRYPTLKTFAEEGTEGVDDDGYEYCYLGCAICGEKIVPKTRRSNSVQYINGQKHWQVEASGIAIEPGKNVSVTFGTDERGVMMFGRAVGDYYNLDSDNSRVSYLSGIGELGVRK